MQLGQLAGDVGRGLAAGLVGTAAMTVSSSIEAKVTGRGSSTTPADATGKVLGVEAEDEQTEQRFNQFAHWGYGTSLGAIRGVLGFLGVEGWKGAGAHFTTIFAMEQSVLPALDVAAPTWQYGPKAFGTDMFHHAVYVAGTALAWDYLEWNGARG